MKLGQFYFTQKVKNKKNHIKSQSYNLKQKLMTELRPLVQDKHFVIEIFGCSHCKSFIRNSINIGNVKIKPKWHKVILNGIKNFFSVYLSFGTGSRRLPRASTAHQ